MTEQAMKKIIKKADIILITAVAALSVLLYFLLYQTPADDTRLSIYVDGAPVMSERLSDIESPVIVENSYGRNVIEIKDGAVEVVWSDCASLVCKHTGKITRPGEVIVCLPHHLLIAIEGGGQPEEIDAIVG